MLSDLCILVIYHELVLLYDFDSMYILFLITDHESYNWQYGTFCNSKSRSSNSLFDSQFENHHFKNQIQKEKISRACSVSPGSKNRKLSMTQIKNKLQPDQRTPWESSNTDNKEVASKSEQRTQTDRRDEFEQDWKVGRIGFKWCHMREDFGFFFLTQITKPDSEPICNNSVWLRKLQISRSCKIDYLSAVRPNHNLNSNPAQRWLQKSWNHAISHSLCCNFDNTDNENYDNNNAHSALRKSL